jgi:hypothetical protein
MDYSSWVDTSLDLNINPLRVKSEVPVDAERFGMARELKPTFMDFQTKPSAKEEVSFTYTYIHTYIYIHRYSFCSNLFMSLWFFVVYLLFFMVSGHQLKAKYTRLRGFVFQTNFKKELDMMNSCRLISRKNSQYDEPF